MSKELIRLRVVVDPEDLAAAPVLYSNHVTAQATPDELFLTFHVRKNHCADFANPDSEGTVQVPGEPLATFVVSVPLALRMAKMILAQCVGNRDASEASLGDAFEGLEIRAGDE
ncbi:MAG: hypothetical protein AMXMBFR81_15670 [Chthonomonas sp.]